MPKGTWAVKTEKNLQVYNTNFFSWLLRLQIFIMWERCYLELCLELWKVKLAKKKNPTYQQYFKSFRGFRPFCLKVSVLNRVQTLSETTCVVLCVVLMLVLCGMCRQTCCLVLDEKICCLVPRSQNVVILSVFTEDYDLTFVCYDW